MNIWKDINPERIKPERFIAVIEIPKGCKKKYELDKETGMLILDRILFTSTHYPANYGFIPLTYAGDNDPLDVLVLCQEEIDPLCLVEVIPIGVMKMIDSSQVDEKIIAVPANDPSFNTYHNIDDLPTHLMVEIGHFFEVYKELEGKKTFVLEIQGKKQAMQIIEESIKSYKDKFLK